jgi:hypothetical protein
MTRMQQFSVTVARLGAGMLTIIVAACGTATGGPAASVTTLMPGWEQKFTVDWTAEPGATAGSQRIRGYVVSRSGRSAEPFRVLGQALDTAGAVVGQRIVWVPGGVPAFGHSYFEVPHLPAANRYLVTVWDYALIREP